MPLSEDLLHDLPRSPGVYLFRDANGEIIYIGKACNLKNRVHDYLGQDTRPSVTFIRRHTARIDYIVTHNDKEALLLENRLIKQHRPRYNVVLKDDKTYVSIKITTSHEWPGIYITRSTSRDGSTYLGPYSSAQATRKTLSAVGRIFPVRRCKDSAFKNRTRPCMFHQIGLCPAPCTRRISADEYRQTINDLIRFLQGQDKDLERELQRRMQIEAAALNYEKAARIRDQIQAIRTTLVPQTVAGTSAVDVDIFGTYRGQAGWQVCVMRFSGGNLCESKTFALRSDSGDFIAQFMLQFYLNDTVIPHAIHTAQLPREKDLLAEILSDMRGSRVTITRPTRGMPLKRLQLADQNARSKPDDQTASPLDNLARAFRLPAIPYRIECYDISTIQGRYSVASRTVFIDGRPDKNLYRRYKIREVKGQDDFAMLREVLARRFGNDASRPDLILIDGGKGQLNACLRIMKEIGRTDIPLAAIAKERGSKSDRFFLPGRKDAVHLPARSAELRIMQQIRDEAHRFAITYHRRVRSTRTTSSILQQIPGIGPQKTARILKHLPPDRDIKDLRQSDLQNCPGLSSADITRIIAFLHDEN